MKYALFKRRMLEDCQVQIARFWVSLERIHNPSKTKYVRLPHWSPLIFELNQQIHLSIDFDVNVS